MEAKSLEKLERRGGAGEFSCCDLCAFRTQSKLLFLQNYRTCVYVSLRTWDCSGTQKRYEKCSTPKTMMAGLFRNRFLTQTNYRYVLKVKSFENHLVKRWRANICNFIITRLRVVKLYFAKQTRSYRDRLCWLEWKKRQWLRIAIKKKKDLFLDVFIVYLVFLIV